MCTGAPEVGPRGCPAAPDSFAGGRGAARVGSWGALGRAGPGRAAGLRLPHLSPAAWLQMVAELL